MNDPDLYKSGEPLLALRDELHLVPLREILESLDVLIMHRFQTKRDYSWSLFPNVFDYILIHLCLRTLGKVQVFDAINS